MEFLVWVCGHLDFHGLETNAEILEFVIIFAQLLLKMRYPVLKKDDTLGSTLGTLDKKNLDVVRLLLTRFKVGDQLRHLLVKLCNFLDDLFGLGNRHAQV